MKCLVAILALCSSLPAAWGQIYSSSAPLTNTLGQPVPGQIAICTTAPSLPVPPATPPNCPAYAVTYTDQTQTTSCNVNASTLGPLSGVGCTNPGNTDTRGNYTIYGSQGIAWLEFYGYGITTYIQPVGITGGTGGGGPAGPWLLADTFSGADICAKVNAAIASLPAMGGTVLLSALNYPPCNNTITITKPDVTLEGMGSGSVIGRVDGATVLNFAAGVAGIVVNGGTSGAPHPKIEHMTLISASTTTGTDNGIYIVGAGHPIIKDVSVKHFGGRGVWIDNNTDFWWLENIEVDSNYKDGFAIAGQPPSENCADANVGYGTALSATFNQGWGFYIKCGVVNTFQTTHASGNTAGAWTIYGSYNYYRATYVEGSANFVTQPGSVYNTFEFNPFGVPTIIDNGVQVTEAWSIPGGAGAVGTVPARTALNVSSMPGATPNEFFTIDTGTPPTGPDLNFQDFYHGTGSILYFDYAGTYGGYAGWAFPQAVRFILPVRHDGAVDYVSQVAPANPGSSLARVYYDGYFLRCLNATGGSCGLLASINGDASAAQTIAAGTGISVSTASGTTTITNTGSGTGGGGISSINSDTTAAQHIVAGTGISVSTASGTTTITNTGSGGGGGGTPGGVSGDIQKNNGTGGFAAASLNDNGSAITSAEPLTVSTLTTGTGSTACGSAVGCIAFAEGAAVGAGAINNSYCRADSSHNILCSISGGSELPMAIMSTVSPTVGQLTCVKSVNPTVLGYCTAVSGATCTTCN